VKVLVVSGIWPPDVGGPASHAPDVAAYLRAHGHEVEVVVTAAAAPGPQPFPVHWIRRSLPKGAIHVRTGFEVARLAARAEVVYTTGMFGRSAAGATLARRPYVIKLTADPAFERARRRGVVVGTVDEFQHAGAGIAVRALRAARDAELTHAAHVFTPSAYLRELATTWGVDPDRVSVLPNPTPPARDLPVPRSPLQAG
jgi:glycosyltransferase involved in cell wall biosynthesis